MKIKDVKNINDLATILEISAKDLADLAYNSKNEKLYTSFEIPKKNGESRTINNPVLKLKEVQKKLATILEKEYKKSNGNQKISHAFQKNKSIFTNAKIHINKKFVLNTDISDFFDSFHFGRVKGFFMKDNNFSFNSEVAGIISNICCFHNKNKNPYTKPKLKNALPQGSPTSPVITNLIFKICDYRIYKLAKKYKLNYTRYADDLTFSTNDKHFSKTFEDFIQELELLLTKSGFSINRKKTRMSYEFQQQKVTGLVVNEKINTQRDFYRNTRSMALSFYKNGTFKVKNKPKHVKTINGLEGRFAYIDQVKGYNSVRNYSDNSFDKFDAFSSFEKQYRKFIFFKYFFYHTNTLVTEGKTDQRYIRAALIKYYKKYPKLIKKTTVKGKDVFQLQFRFLKRGNESIKDTKKNNLTYFLQIPSDGASAMKNIANYYYNKNKKFPQYYDFFKKISSGKYRENKVILLIDNEEDTNKPLKNFLKHIGMKNKKKDIDQNGYLPLEGNLNLVSFEKSESSDDIEIENLLIGIKKSNKKDMFNLNGKDISKNDLSNKVYKNLDTFDLHKFIPVLDNINRIFNED